MSDEESCTSVLFMYRISSKKSIKIEKCLCRQIKGSEEFLKSPSFYQQNRKRRQLLKRVEKTKDYGINNSTGSRVDNIARKHYQRK
jgi:hypothetical protein